jgi:hypothetical protein
MNDIREAMAKEMVRRTDAEIMQHATIYPKPDPLDIIACTLFYLVYVILSIAGMSAILWATWEFLSCARCVQ